MTENRVRYDALLEIVADYVSRGQSPNPAWVMEIEAARAQHPEWVPSPPPPPVVITPPSLPAPPPSSMPPRAAVPLKEGRVQIDIDHDVERMMLKVLEIWGARFCVFQNGGKLLELQIDPGKSIKFIAREVAPPRMVPINATRAWSIAGTQCYFTSRKIAKGGNETNEPQSTPEWLGRALVSRSNFPYIPIISALAQAPTLRADGALIWESGYDQSTGIFLTTDIAVNLPENPSNEDARVAMGRLLDLLTDFDFVNPSGKSVWLAGLLAVVCRHTFDGPSPIIIFDASKRGSGKTMLADIISIIATGSTAPRMFYVEDDVEMDKRISALAISGDQMVLIDNVVGKLASPPLDAALTSTSYRGRVLGKTEMTPALSMKIVWCATGNGMVVGADTARRALLARLEPPVDYPEDRTGPRPGQPWKYPDLQSHAKQQRSNLLADALTIVSAYIRAGRPDLGLTPMGSFEAWSATIRSAIVWAGGQDPCATTKDVRKADLEDQALRRMVECWPVADGVEVTAATLLEWAVTTPQLSLDPAKRDSFEKTRAAREMWRNALLEWLPAKKLDLPTARELGYALRSIDGSIVGDFKVKGGEHQRSGIPWCRVRVGQKIDDKIEEIPDNRTNMIVIK